MGKEREDYPWETVYSPSLKVGMSVLSHLTSRGTGKCDLPLYSEQTGEMGLASRSLCSAAKDGVWHPGKIAQHSEEHSI